MDQQPPAAPPPWPVPPAATPPGQPPEKPSRGGGATHVVTLIVAVVAIVGSVVTTIVGDNLSDNRRLTQERRGAYRDFRAAMVDFDEIATVKLLDRYRDSANAIKTYLDNGKPENLQSDVSEAISAHREEFETMRSRYLEIGSALDDVLLLGSSRAIELANDAWLAAHRLYVYFVEVYNSMADRKLTELTLTSQLANLFDANNWDKIKQRLAFEARSKDFYSYVQREVNPAESGQ